MGQSAAEGRQYERSTIAEADLLTTAAGGTWAAENIYLKEDKKVCFETPWFRPVSITGRTSVALVNLG